MTPPSTILTSDRDRSSAIAWGTLCVLAVVQVGLTLKLLASRNSSFANISPVAVSAGLPAARPASVPVPTPGLVPEVGQISLPPVASARPPLPGTFMQAPAPVAAPPVSYAPPPIGSFSQPGAVAPQTAAAPALPGGVAPFAAPAPRAPSLPPAPRPLPGTSPDQAGMPPPTTNPLGAPPAKPDAATELLKDVNYVVSTAKEIRGASDMQQALELLKRADELTPDHPAIIAEMAQTYEQMGIAAKATDAWRRLQLLGPTRAGSYYELATRRLGSGSAAMALPGLSLPTGTEGEKFLRLGACQVNRDTTVPTGERYVLHVPIDRAGNRPINGQEVNLEVFFFDRVNGTKVEQTIAPSPVETWQSAPVDWNGTGEELLDVIYHLPALSDAEIRQHGRRSYYGYMLKLYYNNKLQDVAAEPRDLLEYGSAPGAAPAGANPLLPPMGR